MVSTSKILTVSYGTFSCTLEGFDDSFDTMKAIAEYFRDLASDDRYFGAEPPTPDAEMLARIAEREISRRVLAHDTDGKIHLRAGTATLAASSQNEAPRARAQEPTPTGAPAASPGDTSATPSASAVSEPYVEASASAPTTHTPQGGSESIADKLRRIRAVASPGASVFPADGFEEDENAQDFLTGHRTEPDHDPIDSAEADTPVPNVDMDQPDMNIPEMGTAAMSVADDDAGSETPDRDDTPQDAIAAADSLDSDAAAPDTAASEQEAETEGEASAEDTATASTDDDILSRLAAHDNDADDAMPAQADTPVAQDSGDDLDRLLDTASGDPDAPTAPEDTPEPDPEAEDTLSQLLADAMDDGPAKPEAVEDDADTHDDDAQDATDTDAHPLTARVVKMKRADLDAALADSDLEEETEEERDTASDAPHDLSPEAEADLLRELAEVETELQHSRIPADQITQPSDTATGHAATEEETQHAEEEEAQQAEESLRARPDHPAPDAQASRIFDEADTQLDEPESNKRRNAIQHLRAAVAATKAERSAGRSMPEGVDDQPYRKDLQSAVRPRRPLAVTSATPRPGAALISRPAPLKLVAEQRIDAPAAPVRPRRITRADLTTAPARATPETALTEAQDHAAPGGFADYADQVGANSLTDLLEAAAAYMVDIEGMPQFSRPMLMQKLREAHEDAFSREEGLRSFGQLLRQGKLQKLKGGRFGVTKVTEFRQSA